MENIEEFYTVAADFVAKNTKDIEKASKALAIGAAVYYTVSKLYDAYFGPLSHLPGPFLGRFSKYSKASLEKPLGTGYVKMLELHNKYGSVVRLGPKYISVSDKDMIKQILVKDDLMKGPNYGFLDQQTMFSTRDKAFHKLRRRVVSPAFSIKYLNSLEPFMDKTLQSFIQKIDKDIKATRNQDGYGNVDLWVLFQCLALDIIGETAFGETFHMIENNNHPVPGSIGKSLMVAHHILADGVFASWIRYLPKAFKGGKARRTVDDFMTRIVQERMQGGEATRRNDILQILIDTQKKPNPEDRLSVQDIIIETVLFLVAGSETTSNTTGFAIIELLRNPEAFAKLRQEIDALPFETGEFFKHDQLKHLPYLNAVISETLRLDWIGALGLDRVATEDIILGKDLLVPKGTIINASIYHLHMNPSIWKNPKEFRPERWLENADPAPDMDAFYPFSAGSRNCIGKNFAMQEMRLALATLLKLYDFKPIPEEMKDAEQVRQYFTLQVKKNSFKCLLKRRSA